VLSVQGLTDRRGPAEQARLYEDLTPPPPPRPVEPTGVWRERGRPTKRERRQLDRLRG
jgi:ribosome-associated heat shock protein Hsp15